MSRIWSLDILLQMIHQVYAYKFRNLAFDVDQSGVDVVDLFPM